MSRSWSSAVAEPYCSNIWDVKFPFCVVPQELLEDKRQLQRVNAAITNFIAQDLAQMLQLPVERREDDDYVRVGFLGIKAESTTCPDTMVARGCVIAVGLRSGMMSSTTRISVCTLLGVPFMTTRLFHHGMLFLERIGSCLCMTSCMCCIWDSLLMQEGPSCPTNK